MSKVGLQQSLVRVSCHRDRCVLYKAAAGGATGGKRDKGTH